MKPLVLNPNYRLPQGTDKKDYHFLSDAMNFLAKAEILFVGDISEDSLDVDVSRIGTYEVFMYAKKIPTTINLNTDQIRFVSFSNGNLEFIVREVPFLDKCGGLKYILKSNEH